MKGKQTVKNTVSNQSKRTPRTRLKGNLNENVSIITGNEYAKPAVSNANATYGHGDILMAPGNTQTRLNASVNRIGAYFQKGIFLPGTHVTYIPSVGLNTPGNIIMGYIDSPEIMRSWSQLTTEIQFNNFIRDLNNSKTGPVWQEMTFPITAAPRRKIFTVDVDLSFANLTETDQSCQGVVVWSVFGANQNTSVTTMGQLVVHTKARFEETKSFILPVL